jgi:hypothetical protein
MPCKWFGFPKLHIPACSEVALIVRLDDTDVRTQNILVQGIVNSFVKNDTSTSESVNFYKLKLLHLVRLVNGLEK